MHTNTHTNELLADILDPACPVLDLCAKHDLSLAQLVEFLKGPLYTELLQAARELANARTQLLTLEVQPSAIRALDAVTATVDESRPVNETIRKAAAKLLTIARQHTTNNSPPPSPPTGKPLATDRQDHAEPAAPDTPDTPQRAKPTTHPNTRTTTPTTHARASSRRAPPPTPVTTHANPNHRPTAAAIIAAAGAPPQPQGPAPPI